MEDDNNQQQLVAVEPPAQKIIPPYQYFPFERALFFVAIVCMVLGFPILLFRESIRTIPFGFLCFVVSGIGVILLALTITIAEIHFRRSAVSTVAIVVRERRLVEDYFTPKPVKKPAKQPPTKLPTIVVQFTTQIGTPITLEILSYRRDSSERGQPITITYLAHKPQVATIEAKSTTTFVLAGIYWLFGAALAVGGITLFR